MLTQLHDVARVSTRHVSSTLIPAMWEQRKAAVHDVVTVACSVAITVDSWMDRVMHSYLAITVHTFVKYTPKSCLLTFTAFDGSHTGVRVSEAIT